MKGNSRKVGRNRCERNDDKEDENKVILSSECKTKPMAGWARALCDNVVFSRTPTVNDIKTKDDLLFYIKAFPQTAYIFTFSRPFPASPWGTQNLKFHRPYLTFYSNFRSFFLFSTDGRRWRRFYILPALP